MGRARHGADAPDQAPSSSPRACSIPGVLVSDDAEAHIHNLKRMPMADAIIDKCIECGFCERMCPSKGMTLSPRQRIVGWREIARRDARGEDTGEWRDLYDYHGIDTCAACGLCATVCPVSIDTGLLTRALRGKRRGPVRSRRRCLGGRNYATVNTATRLAFGARQDRAAGFGPGHPARPVERRPAHLR